MTRASFNAHNVSSEQFLRLIRYLTAISYFKESNNSDVLSWSGPFTKIVNCHAILTLTYCVKS